MEIKVIASSSKGNAYSVSDGKTKLLIECGVPVAELHKATGYKLSEYAGCLVSHEHGDHAKSVVEVSRYMPIYASAGTFSAIKNCVSNKKILIPLEPIQIGTFSSIAFPLEHDAEEPIGFYLTSTTTSECLLFFTDTYFLRYKFPRIDYLMGECNYDEQSLNSGVMNGEDVGHIVRVTKSHMGLSGFVDFLNKNDLSYLKKIYVMHLSDGHANAERIKSEIQKVAGCEVEICNARGEQ